MKRKTILILVLTMFLIFSASIISAQPPPPPPQDIPIDGGLIFLVAAGMIYGGREIYKHEKNKNKNNKQS